MGSLLSIPVGTILQIGDKYGYEGLYDFDGIKRLVPAMILGEATKEDYIKYILDSRPLTEYEILIANHTDAKFYVVSVD